MKSPDSPRPSSALKFSLRSLFLVTTIVGVVCGLFTWLPAASVVGVLLIALSVVAHVAGNAIGTRLRAQSDHSIKQPRVDLQHTAPETALAPTTSLSEHSSLGWIIVLPTLLGAAAGMLGGVLWMRMAYGQGSELGILAIGSIAFATLGAFAAFCLATLTHVTAVAISQALRHR